MLLNVKLHKIGSFRVGPARKPIFKVSDLVALKSNLCKLEHQDNMSLVVRNRSSGFPTRSDTNRAVQQQKMARGLKFRTYDGEVLYYPCSENKGADQLRGYPEADLRCKNPVFS